MPDKHSKFHEFSLRSILFKGRADWYFCYLKSEKIAYVLMALCEVANPAEREQVADMARRAAGLPPEIAHLAAGEIEPSSVLADVFGLLSAVRALGAQQILGKETTELLVAEYEQLAERLVAGSHPSPFVSAEDFSIGTFVPPSEQLSLTAKHQESSIRQQVIKDTKGHKGQNDRMSLILNFIQKQKSASIKDIAAVVKGCSEKTIQRELSVLISQGLVRKVGERRWSVYIPA